MKTRMRWAALAAVMVCGFAFFLLSPGQPAWQAHAGDGPALPANVAGVWLDRPDALIRSESLTSLPRDLLTVPLLKDVLTEDLLFYYDTDEDWLGLKGTLRRLAYEHDLDLGDHLVSLLLDRPADVLLWRDGKSALRHYALLLERDPVVGVAEQLVKIAQDDRQLRQIGSFEVVGLKVPVLALELSPRRSLVLFSFGKRLVVLSSPDLVLKADGSLDESFIAAATRWLAPEAKDRIGRFENYALPGELEARHSLLLSSRFLSQGYSGFFPELAALRFDFRDAWSTSGLFNLPAQAPAASFSADTWKRLPVNPAACAQVPARWLTLQRFLPNDGEFNAKAAQKVLQQLEPAGAVCWYADARLYEPLFMARLKPSAGNDVNTALRELFDWSINTAGGDKFSDRQKHEISMHKDGVVLTWRRAIAVANGTLNPTLVRAGNTLYFSASDALVERAQAMFGERYPAVADSQDGSAGLVLLHVETDKLATLLGDEFRATVDAGSDDAALLEHRLVPRLTALGRHGRLELSVAADQLQPGLAWHPLVWAVAQP